MHEIAVDISEVLDGDSEGCVTDTVLNQSLTEEDIKEVLKETDKQKLQLFFHYVERIPIASSTSSESHESTRMNRIAQRIANACDCSGHCAFCGRKCCPKKDTSVFGKTSMKTIAQSVCGCDCNVALCGKKDFVIGYKMTDIKQDSLQEGSTTAAMQWKDTRHALWTVGSLVLKFTLYSALFLISLFSFGDNIYQTGERRQVLFDFIDAFLSLVGDIVTLIALIVALVRRPEEIMKDLKSLCAMCASCLRIQKPCCSTSDKPIDSPTYCCCSGENGTETARGLSSTGGKVCTVIANSSEIFLSLFDEILATIILITSLYSFIGEQNFRTFYGVTEWTEVPSMMLILLSFLLYLKSHYDRVENIFGNVRKFDSDILDASKEHNKLSKIVNRCTLLFGFQWRMVIHAVLLSLLQIFCLLALVWKIIRDTCQSPAEAQLLAPTSIEDLLYWEYNKTTVPTSEYGALGNCTLPSLSQDKINFYTVYSILYVSIILPVMSYLLLLVSNLPYFTDYLELLYYSGLYNAEQVLKGGHVGDISVNKLEMFAKVIAGEQVQASVKCNVAESDMEQKMRKIPIIKKEVENDYIQSSQKSTDKLRAVLTSIPTVIIGIIHFILFFANIGFLTCRYSPQLGVTCLSPYDLFNVFTTDVWSDIGVLVIPLIILLLLVGFPGPILTIVWICIIAAIVTVVIYLFFLYCLCYMACAESRPRSRRY